MTADSLTTEKDKTQLLDYLRKIHGAKDEKSNINLPRRQTSEINNLDCTSRPRRIIVEIRKKNAFGKDDLSEAGSVIFAPTPPPGKWVAFYVFERLENDQALTIRFIGHNVRVRLQEWDNAASKSVRYAYYMYPLHPGDDLPTLFIGWDKVSKATLELPFGKEIKIDSGFAGLVQPAPYIVLGERKYLYDY